MKEGGRIDIDFEVQNIMRDTRKQELYDYNTSSQRNGFSVDQSLFQRQGTRTRDTCMIHFE